MVQLGYYVVGCLTRVNWLIYKVIYLTGESLIAYAKYAALSWGQKVHWAGLEWITGVMNLLGHVKAVVSSVQHYKEESVAPLQGSMRKGREENTSLYHIQPALAQAGPSDPGDEAHDRSLLVLPTKHQPPPSFGEPTR